MLICKKNICDGGRDGRVEDRHSLVNQGLYGSGANRDTIVVPAAAMTIGILKAWQRAGRRARRRDDAVGLGGPRLRLPTANPERTGPSYGLCEYGGPGGNRSL